MSVVQGRRIVQAARYEWEHGQTRGCGSLALQSDRLAVPDDGLQRALDAALRHVIGDDWSTKMRNVAEILAPRPSGLPALSLVAIPMGADNPIVTAAASVRCAVFAYGDVTATKNTGRRGRSTVSTMLN